MKKMSFCLLGILVMMGEVFAQVDQKYLAGAVPEEDGKVVFKEEFKLPGLSKAQIYERALAWAKARYSEENQIPYTDAEKGVFSCRGNEDIVFKSSALSLDKTEIRYQLNVFCEDNLCEAELKTISYLYNVSYKSTPELYKAEEWITDKEAVNKNKLYRNNGKFRIKTIDLVDELFTSLAFAVEGKSASESRQSVSVTPASRSIQAAAVPAVAPVVMTVPTAAAAGLPVPSSLKSHKKIDADKIPGNIIRQLSNDWMLITAGNDEKFNMMTASWGGLGVLWEKPLAFCFINPLRYTYQLMDQGTYYTISFYTEAYRDALQYCGSVSGKDTDKVKGSGLTPITMPSGSKAFEEAWLILECKKVLGQQLIPDAVFDQEVKEKWAGKQLHKLFGGEIIGVWVK